MFCKAIQKLVFHRNTKGLLRETEISPIHTRSSTLSSALIPSQKLWRVQREWKTFSSRCTSKAQYKATSSSVMKGGGRTRVIHGTAEQAAHRFQVWHLRSDWRDLDKSSYDSMLLIWKQILENPVYQKKEELLVVLNQKIDHCFWI